MDNNEYVYELSGGIDSSNAVQFENDLFAKLKNNKTAKKVILDGANLNYISSAGLRVILRLKKEYDDTRIINLKPDVYDIFEMTGFTKIMNVEKALRKISVDGCEIIGQGAHGTVYRIAPDTIVKVYTDTSIEDIKQEKELAKQAFIMGVPTAIPYDTVLVGDKYGTVFELLDAESAGKYIKRGKKELDDFILKSAKLLKVIHAIEVPKGLLPDMKEKTYGYLGKIKGVLSEEINQKLLNLVNSIPDSHTLIHCDYHIKNIMMSKGEPMLIDMDTLCTGDPLFEMAALYNPYHQFPIIDRQESALFLGIDFEMCTYILENTIKHYYEGESEKAVKIAMEKAHILGAIRVINFILKRSDEKLRARYINKCREDIIDCFNELDKLEA